MNDINRQQCGGHSEFVGYDLTSALVADRRCELMAQAESWRRAAEVRSYRPKRRRVRRMWRPHWRLPTVLRPVTTLSEEPS
jgi:hypothetical protein